jgi:hypothetical protein
MTPRPFSRPLNLAFVLVVCAVLLGARFLLNHAPVETAPLHTAVDTPPELPDGLPPVW